MCLQFRGSQYDVRADAQPPPGRGQLFWKTDHEEGGFGRFRKPRPFD